MVPNYLPDTVNVFFNPKMVIVGLGPLEGEIDPDLVNAGGQPAGILPGGAFFDSVFSFELIRGGHVDVTVLGGTRSGCQWQSCQLDGSWKNGSWHGWRHGFSYRSKEGYCCDGTYSEKWFFKNPRRMPFTVNR